MHAAEEQELKMSAEETESIFSYLSRDARDDLVHLAKYAEKLPGIASSFAGSSSTGAATVDPSAPATIRARI